MRRACAVPGVVPLAAAVLVSCSASVTPHMNFGPPSALFDTPLTAAVDGLDSGAGVTLTMTTQDDKGVTWTSSAMYTADAQGRVTLTSPATGGAYTGDDPSGLVDALHPTIGSAPITFAPPSTWRITLTARVGNREVGQGTVRRLLTTDLGVTVRTLTVATDGLAGIMAEPADTSERGPAAVVWGGSQGGLSTELLAKLLAAHGYPTLALAYFGEPGLPSQLAGIPMEYFAKAVTYLDGRPGVDPAKVVAAGASRGSEAAELLGVERPDLVHGVIGLSPSGVVNGGYPDSTTAAWTLGGVAIPFAPYPEFGDAHPSESDTVIPIERVDGPVLLACGEQDRVWPSCDYATAMVDRRPEHPVTVLRDADAGHYVDIAVPWLPTPGGAAAGATLETGGTAVADGRSRVNNWPHVLAFLAGTP